MKEESVYKILNWILLPFTLLLAIMTLFVLFNALLYPLYLLVVLLMVCVLIYTITSVRFFRKYILPDKVAPLKLGKWIRRSGFVTSFFIFDTLFNVVGLLTNNKMLGQKVAQFFEMMQPSINELSKSDAATASMLTEGLLYDFFTFVLIVLFIYTMLLLLHLIMSFRFLSKYRDLLAGQ